MSEPETMQSEHRQQVRLSKSRPLSHAAREGPGHAAAEHEKGAKRVGGFHKVGKTKADRKARKSGGGGGAGGV